MSLGATWATKQRSRLAAENQSVPADLIIHAAVEYSAVEFLDITAEKVDQALRAKVVGICRILGTFPGQTTVG